MAVQGRKMGTDKSFRCILQIEIERCPHRAAERRIPRDHGIDKVRRKTQWIEPVRNGRRFRQKRFLFATDHTQLRQTRERTLIFSTRLLRMSPRIESSRRLRQTGKKN